MKGDWEVPATLNHTWGFKKDDTDWKTPEDLTFKLVDIVSKGGNYLLERRTDLRRRDPASQPGQSARRSASWLKVNGEAIYGAGPTPVRRRTGHSRQHHAKTKRATRFQDRQADWRCTTKPGKLYIHFFKWPAGAFELDKVEGKVKKAYLLADAKHSSLKMKQSGDKLSVTLPAKAPDAIDSVLVLETAN